VTRQSTYSRFAAWEAPDFWTFRWAGLCFFIKMPL